MTLIRFGTDGWRALIAEDFTFENVARCAQGTASYLKHGGTAKRGLVVGYDTRFASAEFAATVAEVMAGNGVLTFLSSKPVPTPVTSYNILYRGAAGAVIITASHNPALWNGYKYKPSYAGSATPEITDQLEHEIERTTTPGISSITLESAREKQLVQDIDPMPPYLEQVARMVDLDAIRNAGLKVVVDAMYGAGSGYIPTIISGEATRSGLTSVLEINGERNPAFPGIERPEPIASNLSVLVRTVLDQGADLGIAFDGDADRVGIVDEKGTVFTTLQTFALLALYLLDLKGERGAIVKSLTSTSMIYRLGEVYDVPVIETPVGFKYICPVMLKENALMGGEESGGYGFRGHIPERDGILSSLMVLEYMAKTGKSASQLLDHLYSIVGPNYYQRRDVTFPSQARAQLQDKIDQKDIVEVAGMPVLKSDSIDGRRFFFSSTDWLLVRFSGTEPLIRIYSEAASPDMVEKLLDGAEALLGF